MRHFYLLTLLLGLLTACSPDSARPPTTPAAAPAAAPAPAKPAAKAPWPPAEVYIGTIGPYPVVLGLSRTGAEVNGRYYYLRQADRYHDLALAGQLRGDSLRLVEFDEEGRQTHALRGVLAADGSWRGQWQAFGAGKALPFALRRRPRPDYEQYREAWQQALTGAPAHDGWRLDTVELHVQADTAGMGPSDPERAAGLPDPLCYYRTLLSFPRLTGGPAPLRGRLNALLEAEARSHVEPDSPAQRIRPATARDTGQYCQFDATTVHYLNRELISFDGLSRDETPHGDELRYWCHRTLRLPDLRPFALTELLRGDFRAVFRRYVRESLAGDERNEADQPAEPGSHCRTAYIRQLLLAQVDSLRTTATVLMRPGGLQILTYDRTHDFGCPNFERGPIELVIPYAALQPYLRPGGPLARVAAEQAARLRRVEAPFRAAVR